MERIIGIDGNGNYLYEDNGQLDQEIQKVINENFLNMIGEDSDNRLTNLNKACEDKHWQDVRERAAIAAMQGTISTLSNNMEIHNEIPKEIAEFSVACANSLIEELKKGSEE